MDEKDPIQRQLGWYELANPSLRRRDKIVFNSRVINYRIGTDFMTNQPKYLSTIRY